MLDLGFVGPPFTWSRGDLKERIDRVLSNETWLSMFPDCSVTHLPIPTFDNCGLWTKTTQNRNLRNNYFKFLGSWLNHPDFSNLIANSWRPSSPWNHNIEHIASKLKSWNKETFGNIFKRKERVLRRLEGINRVLLNRSVPRLLYLRKKTLGGIYFHSPTRGKLLVSTI